MTEYNDALDSQAEVGRLKRDLPIAYVLAYANLRPEQFGTRVRAMCPFHDDHDPSLEVWQEDDGTQRWGCWPCGRRGDVIDLIRWLWGLGFTAGVEAGRTLRLAAGDWQGPSPAAGSTWDAAGAAQLMMTAYKAFDSGAVANLISIKGWRFTPWTLRDRLCGTSHGRLIVPYFDRDHRLVAIKHRSLAGNDKLISMPGSQLRGTLYGDADPETPDPYLICEGESDTWTASSAGAALNVRGLPSGAGTPPYPFIERLAGRRVYLAFDGDEAGDSGAQRWHRELSPRSTVIWLSIPRGEDVTSIGDPSWLKGLE